MSPLAPMTPIRAIVYLILGFGCLAGFIILVGTITQTIDPGAALGVVGTIIIALIGVVGARMAADAKYEKGRRDDP